MTGGVAAADLTQTARRYRSYPANDISPAHLYLSLLEWPAILQDILCRIPDEANPFRRETQ